MKKIVLGIGGASGSRYAYLLMQRLIDLKEQWQEIAVTYTENALINWQLEMQGSDFRKEFPFAFYERRDFRAPFASGSSRYDVMIICPCSMGLLGRIANGLSDDLLTRAADVMLKERRKIILVPRDTPLSLVHVDNMAVLLKAGAIICPAVPSLYSQPATVDDVLLTVVDRVLDLAGLEVSTYRWGQ